MIDAIILRFDAPLISFGGVVVDNNGVTRMFPAGSMLTGLLGNALGYDHGDAASLEALQGRLAYAVRCDRPGELLTDFQTVDLSQPFLARGWTTRGVSQGRAGAEATRTGTHIRRRDYLADAIYTVALALDPPHVDPAAGRIEAALRAPARPLFIGRKPCLPAAPIFLQRVEAETLRAALVAAPRADRAGDQRDFRAWFPAAGPSERGALPVTDTRDWTNQIHVGRRFVREDRIHV